MTLRTVIPIGSLLQLAVLDAVWRGKNKSEGRRVIRDAYKLPRSRVPSQINKALRGLAVSVLMGGTALLAGCLERDAADDAVTSPQNGDSSPVFSLASFSDIAGWENDDLGAALLTFRRSCARILAAPGTRALDPKTGADSLYGQIADWQPICDGALSADAARDPKGFFETGFQPFRVAMPSGGADGLITGYYEPEVRASLYRGGPYQTPLLTKPDDLLRLNLGDFDPSLRGETVRGRIEGGHFVPYPDRAAINRGALSADRLAVAWLADPVDAFFVHIQGSARLMLPDGDVMRVGFAEKNGRPYTAIGKVLVERGALAREAVTMQSIRDWLSANPSEMEIILEANQSYVFFNAVPIRDRTLGPTGAGGVALTSGRSLAVDRRIHGLGAPVWVQADLGTGTGGRLMVAQDTGSAIRGAVRGDYFWGSGAQAGARAGETKAQGQFWTLIPRALAQKWADKGGNTG